MHPMYKIHFLTKAFIRKNQLQLLNSSSYNRKYKDPLGFSIPKISLELGFHYSIKIPATRNVEKDNAHAYLDWKRYFSAFDCIIIIYSLVCDQIFFL
mmetsp:Transcript_35978/g.54784  ORF Transcript_35978/g.54784 Transcript_35978/m.54784 type:complete len:97 (+) Transcript_35978:203-493(+)